jgi:hypothetical protein
MPDGQRCEFSGCGESIAQPAGGGPHRRYCSYEHKAAARRLRSAARITSGTDRAPRPLPEWVTDPFSTRSAARSSRSRAGALPPGG